MPLLLFAERLRDDAPRPAYAKPLGSQFSGALLAAQAGGEWAWSLLYRSLAPTLLRYLRAQGAYDAEGLLGDVFVQLARNIGTFEGDETAFRSWALMVSHHRVVDERRGRNRRPYEPVAQVPDSPTRTAEEDDFIDRQLSAEVVTALATLTPQQRDVVLLRAVAELSLEEVSAIVGRPVSAVKALQRRAYAQLRKKIPDRRYPSDGVER